MSYFLSAWAASWEEMKVSLEGGEAGCCDRGSSPVQGHLGCLLEGRFGDRPLWLFLLPGRFAEHTWVQGWRQALSPWTKLLGLRGVSGHQAQHSRLQPVPRGQGKNPCCDLPLPVIPGPSSATFPVSGLHPSSHPPPCLQPGRVFSLDDIWNLLIVVTLAYICIPYANQAIYF